jgi:hypothetical protein
MVTSVIRPEGRDSEPRSPGGRLRYLRDFLVVLRDDFFVVFLFLAAMALSPPFLSQTVKTMSMRVNAFLTAQKNFFGRPLIELRRADERGAALSRAPRRA